MFSFFYFSTFLLGIAIILNEILLYSELMKLMKRWKSYEDENPGNNHMFINTFTFQKHWEVQYYLYAWFVLILCFLVIHKAERFFNPSKLIIVKEMTLAIGQILLIFIIILIAFGLHGYMAFGDKIDSYSRITASITTSLGDVLGNVDYDKKAGIVPFWSLIHHLLVIFLGVFVLFNLIIAAMTDKYEEINKIVYLF